MNKICLYVVVLLALVSAQAFASIPKEDMYIGGMSIGTTRDEVIKNYGTATKNNRVTVKDKEICTKDYYGLIDARFNHYEIFICYENNKIISIGVSTDKLSTSKGLRCNMNEESINIYGQADEIIAGKNKSYHYYNINNPKEFLYINVNPITSKIVSIGLSVLK